MSTCFITLPLLGTCIAQNNAVSAAIVAALASLAVSGWKIYADRDLRSKQERFERGEREARQGFENTIASARKEFESREREARQSFESAQQDARQAYESTQAELSRLCEYESQERSRQFESSQREARQQFENDQHERREEFQRSLARQNSETQARMQLELQTFVSKEELRKDSWKQTIARLETASEQLARTSRGLISLIEEGPNYEDLRMIQETARVLDVFGDFQTSVGHFALPTSVTEVAEQIVSHATRILLTLSPMRSVRQSEERRTALVPLREELVRLVNMFKERCGDIERDPTLYLQGSRAA